MNNENGSNGFDINCKIGKVIGRGSFGIVYLCTDLDTGAFYAVKHVSLETRFMDANIKKVKIEIKYLKKDNNFKINFEQAIKMIESEIEILKKLDHERIIKYYGTKTQKEGVFVYFCFNLEKAKNLLLKF